MAPHLDSHRRFARGLRLLPLALALTAAACQSGRTLDGDGATNGEGGSPSGSGGAAGGATRDAGPGAGGRATGTGGAGAGAGGSGGAVAGSGGAGGRGAGGVGAGGMGVAGSGDGGHGAGGTSSVGGNGGGARGVGGNVGTGGTPGTYSVTVSTVSVAGGTGRVASAPIAGGAPAQIDCGTTCSTTVPAFAEVVLTATPNAGFYFSAWDGACAGNPGPECHVTVVATTAVAAKFTIANKMFVSSKTYALSALAGVPGATNQCKVLAAAAGLSGTFIPFLRDDTNNTFTQQLGSAPNGPARGWLRVDGKPFADDLNGGIFYSPEINETGAIVSDPLSYAVVHTPTALPCSSTNSPEIGTPTGGGSAWSFYGQTTCSTLLRIYCFQIDYSAVLTFTKAPGWNIFVTDDNLGGVDPSTGLAGADAVCNSQAAMGGLPGRYRAMLATTTASVASRFTSVAASQQLVRPDGVVVAARASNLFQAGGSRLSSTLTVNALGKPIDRLIVTGLPQTATADFTTLAVPALNCSNWSTTSSTVSRNGGDPRASDFFTTSFASVASGCSDGPALGNVACLQF